jgi:prepilin-type N-terminal cleavage/methylation domain-containing protein
MRVQRAFTLAELIVTILMISVLTLVAVPRLQFGLRQSCQAEATAWMIVTDLRRTRSLAILHAATNPNGFALNIKATGKGTDYEIVDLASHAVIDVHTVDASIAFAGRKKFEFSPLGVLKEKNDPTLSVSATGRTFTISIIPGTGTVRCIENGRT